MGTFVAEAAIKILAEGKRPYEYWRDGWNLFNFAIVALSLLPLSGGNAVTVLRLLRLLRVLKLVRGAARPWAHPSALARGDRAAAHAMPPPPGPHAAQAPHPRHGTAEEPHLHCLHRHIALPALCVRALCEAGGAQVTPTHSRLRAQSTCTP